MNNELVARIQKHYKGLSQGHRLVAEELVRNSQLLAFGTAAEIGRKVGVSESTVIRLAAVLGYKGFPDMQSHAQSALAPKLMPDLVSRAASEYPGGTGVMNRVLEHDMGLLRQTVEQNTADAFDRAVDLLAGARHIYVTGTRSSYGVAHFLWYTLRFQLGAATFLEAGNPSFYTDLDGIGPDSALVAIAFPRYSEATLNITQFASARACPLVAMTDTPLSPVGRLAQAVLVTPTESVAATMSYVPALALATALITGVALRSKPAIEERLNRLEVVTDRWKEITRGI